MSAVEVAEQPTTKKKTTRKAAAKTIDQRLMDCWGDIRGVLKDARNDFAKYDYPKADSVIRDCRAVLLTHGLILNAPFAYNETEHGSVVVIRFRLCSPESNEERIEEVTYPVCERGGMPKDKATLASLTTCYTYYLRQLFMLPRVDSMEELDSIDDRKFDPSQNGEVGNMFDALCSAMKIVGLDHTRGEVQQMVTSRASAQGRKVDVAFLTECIERLNERKD